MKRFLVLTICILILALGGAFLYLRARKYDVTITQTQIDDALKARFPVSKTYLLIFRITYSNPKVRLLPDTNRIEIGLDAELNIKLPKEPKTLGGTALVTSGITYRSESHQFFLSEPEINKLTIQGIPQEHLDKATQLASTAAREFLQERSIYTLKATDAKTTTTKLLLKNVEVKSSEVHATLGL